MRTVTGREARVESVRLHAEKLPVHKRVKHHLAHRPFHAEETLHLFGFQPQSGHFEIFRANPFDNVVSRSHGDLLLGDATELANPLTMRERSARRGTHAVIPVSLRASRRGQRSEGGETLVGVPWRASRHDEKAY